MKYSKDEHKFIISWSDKNGNHEVKSRSFFGAMEEFKNEINSKILENEINF